MPCCAPSTSNWQSFEKECLMALFFYRRRMLVGASRMMFGEGKKGLLNPIWILAPLSQASHTRSVKIDDTGSFQTKEA